MRRILRPNRRKVIWGAAWWAMALCLFSSCWAQAPPPAATPAPVIAPVAVDGRTLFNVQTGLGPFTAQERATAAAERLDRLVKDVTIPVQSITAVANETSTDVVLKDQVLLTVTDSDARAAGRTRGQLAAERIASIRTGVTELRARYSTRSLLLGALYTLISTAVFWILLTLLRRLWSRGIEKLRRIHIPPVRIQSVVLVSSQRIQGALIQTAKVVRVLLVLFAVYIYLPLVLSFFPWTQGYAPLLVDYVTAPLRSAAAAVLAYLPSLFVVIISAAGAYLLIRIAQFLFRELGHGTIALPGFYAEWADPTYKIIRFLILAMTVVVAFPYLPGSRSPAFQGISIFLGVLFSLGSTSAVANIIGGVILTYTRAFKVGDRVKIADTIGDVTEKSLLATRVRTIKNEFITVPNSMVLSSHIINYSAAGNAAPLILHTAVTIGYDAPWRTVHALLKDAAARTSKIVKEPAPFVLQTALNDFYVTYEINAYTCEPASMALTYAELHQNIQDCFNEAGVEIMSAHYAYLRDGNSVTTPRQYLPKDYDAPSFRFEQTQPGSKPTESG